MASKCRTLGVYVGLAVDPDVDWNHICQETVNAGYNSISVFLTTAFFNKGLWPWPLVGGKFDFSKLNDDYRQHFRRACQAAKAADLQLHLCIVDQFHSSGDYPGPDPFRQVFGDWDEEPLYSSWDGSKYTWLAWDKDKDPKYLATPEQTLKQFKPVGAFGNGMYRFMRMLANVLRTTGVRFSVKWGNETLAQFNPLTGKATNKRGDRDEVVIWLRSMLQDAGLTFDLYFDYLCTTLGKKKVDPDYVHYPTMQQAFRKGVRVKHHAKMEIHGILRVADTARFGFKPTEVDCIKWSTDGDMLMRGDYPGLGKSALPDVDLKMDARKVTATDVTTFFDSLIGKYATYL